jgi:hypothetical protein
LGLPPAAKVGDDQRGGGAGGHGQSARLPKS